ncbi:glucose/quinate/shikimate family membrane-bound PQQ-dependent dehydrogenase [Acinetobacter ursingii]|uniref:glucose/quinate/shikimate family membrane-bound PQQ-dependent dehydrogenase n=1 Tax=Acinetobacter ursingii TaxID=108980 RepID=UPI00124DF613|nr:glucose/quinate/shikimate family membrane-bound PQQ-dependent dehydrogenase [Acinetobacter ursingii]MCU4304633.1 glucose/quinate/shikimate family membrane-bound PQQ-dependent dehydrogenase [Acinetobacter ursingii]MCU4370638.1 glucose/quinate/shikimate family membrane-bound PQQ-dependent dehydrogenase [Acinetobacter ursingii]MDG9991036.1 glucose/quinate/shikimate family membrane-bound PQQ-dependent dehydrogenase [Acinetobacter ursingii]MDH0203226.1 glucose/quinate/shikimate family membrane-bo
MSDPQAKSHIILKIWCFILGLALLITGLFYIIGGGKLISLGGSWYFLIAGLFTIASAFFIFKKKALGVWLFALVFVGTVIWALIDAGWEFWPLHSRLMFPAGLFAALLLTLPSIRKYQYQTSLSAPAYIIGGLTVLGMIGGLYGMFIPHPTVKASGEELPLVPVDPAQKQVNWDHYGNDAGGSRFAALDQINRNNVSKLKEVWRFRTGDFTTGTGNGAEDQSTPLQVGDKVFLCTPHNNIFALDADTGKQLWKAEVNSKADAWERCRGVAYFDSTQPLLQPTLAGATPVATVTANTECPRRVYTNTPDGRLIAVNADTGERCKDFGVNGTVDLLQGLGDGTKAPRFEVTSAPTVAGSVLVIGSRIADNVAADMPGGVIRAYDVITGQLRWAFDARNPDPNYVLKPGENYKRSSANSWAAMSYDPQMNTVFLPMGSSSVDVWGGNRTAPDHKYNTSVLALDASTGKEKWVYQTVHNDLWDFDLPMQPSLVDFPMKDGTTKPAVVIGTKSGQFYVLDRVTGQPLTKVENQQVKVADIPGEQYSKVQPRSVEMPQIGNQTLTESDMWGATPFDQLMCRISFKSMRYDGLYTAPGTDISLSFPGSLGGMNWGSIAFDPSHRYMFVNDMRLGLWIQLIKQTPEDVKIQASGGEKVNTGMGAVPMAGTPYKVNKNRFMSALGIPCQKPPFGTMTAIDMKTRQVAWQVPLGTIQDTGPMGIKMGLKAPIGMPTIGGPMATQGGLVFFAATQDYYLRAFDSSNGKELWKARLPVGSQGTPMSYVSPKTGRQYVVISAGGARQSPDHGDYVVAYALDK